MKLPSSTLAWLAWVPGLAWTARWALFPQTAGWDRDIYCAAQYALAHGQDAYDPAVIDALGAGRFPVLYSPLVLALMPACVPVAYAAWQAALLALTLASLRTAGVPLRTSGALLLCPMLGIGPDVRAGNVTLLELALLAVAVSAAARERSRLLGVALACAGFIKVLPLTFAAGLFARVPRLRRGGSPLVAGAATLALLTAASFALDPAAARRWTGLLWQPHVPALHAMFSDRTNFFEHGPLPLLRDALGVDTGTIVYAVLAVVLAGTALWRVRQSALGEAPQLCLFAACLVPLWPRHTLYMHVLALPWVALVLERLDPVRRDRLLAALCWGTLALYLVVLPARVSYAHGGAHALFGANLQWFTLVAVLGWILCVELPRVARRD